MFKRHSFAVDLFRLGASEDVQRSCASHGSRMEQVTIAYETRSNDTMAWMMAMVPSKDQSCWNRHGRER